MNAFADSLLSVLLGWVKTVVRAVFDFFVSDPSAGFYAWLGNNWLGLAAVLCLVGVIIDVVVWVIRWQPYRVWEKERRKRKQRKKEAAFERGYQDAPQGLDIDLREEEEPAVSAAPPLPPVSYEAESDRAEPEAPRRHRRSGRKLLEKLRDTLNEDENGLDPGEVLSGTGSARDTYHEPVYPNREHQ